MRLEFRELNIGIIQLETLFPVSNNFSTIAVLTKKAEAVASAFPSFGLALRVKLLARLCHIHKYLWR